MTRRLAAILAADMAGYSRLMGGDEAGTLARLKTHRIELIDPAIGKNDGRIIKTTGDGLLVEFASVVDAVRCAVEIQSRMMRRNSDVPPERRIEFRIGINLGDVIFEDDDLFGDGVNVAARLQQIAEPGGICVAGAVRDQTVDKVQAEFRDLGERQLKNISRSVRAWCIVPASAPRQDKPGQEAASARSGRPTLAVLPFVNMSGDPEQEFFVDGLTEDILTELARRHELFVISRNATFVYKGQAVSAREVADKLGAQYVVEGSVRKSGDRLRVTAQLIEAASDRHIWAERYDRKLSDVFEIQDQVTAAIVATLPGRVEAAQHDYLARKTPASLVAYECVLAAKVLHHRGTVEDNARALELLDRAIVLEPDYAHAHAWRACVLGQAWTWGWCEDKEATWDEVVASLERAQVHDDNDADVHRILAAVDIAGHDLVKARYHQERALALNPNYDLIVVQQGELLTWIGRPEEGVEWIRRAMQINPHHPERFWSHLGRAHFVARQYKEAIEAYMHLRKLDFLQHAFLACCYARLGDETAAAAHRDRVLDLEPGFTVESHLDTLHYEIPDDREHHAEALRKAGFT